MNSICNWKPSPVFPDRYSVSDDGRVRNERTGKVLKPVKQRSGYLRVKLCGPGRVIKSIYVHRLIALAFIENPLNKNTVNHLDECKTNNKATNLEWATNKEQNTYGTRIERAVKHTDYKARNIDYYKIAKQHDYTKEYMCNRKKCKVVMNDTLIGVFKSQREASSYTGVSCGKISQCISGKKTSCKGFSFERVKEEEDHE